MSEARTYRGAASASVYRAVMAGTSATLSRKYCIWCGQPNPKGRKYCSNLHQESAKHWFLYYRRVIPMNAALKKARKEV